MHRSIVTPGKMDELRLECATRKPDIIVITESWLSTCHDDSIFHIRNYILFRQDRLNKSGGGVAVWINASLHSERLFPTCTSPMGEYLFLNFKYNLKLYAICAAYIPPQRSSQDEKEIIDFIIDELDVISAQHPNCFMIVCGDLNRLDTDLLESSHDLIPKVSDPTRGAAILDQILISSNISQFYPCAEAGPPLFSGRRGSHGQVFLTAFQRSDPENVTVHTIFDCRKPYVEKFLASLTNCSFKDVYHEPDLDNKVTLFYEHFLRCLSQIPRKQITLTPKDKPWMTPILKDLITQRWSAFRSRNFREYNRLKLKCKDLILKNKKSWCEKIKQKDRNPWSVVNDIRGKTSSNPIQALIAKYSSVNEAVEEINKRLSLFSLIKRLLNFVFLTMTGAH